MALEYVRRGVRASSGGLVPDADDISAVTTAIVGTSGALEGLAAGGRGAGERRLVCRVRGDLPALRLAVGGR
jgi:hypothetical protein